MTDLDTGAAEQPAGTIHDSIMAAFAEHEAPEVQETPAAEEASSSAERARDEKGRFVKQEGSETSEAAPAVEDKPAAAPAAETPEETPAQPTTAEPPAHWSADDKALVAKLPEEHRAAVIDRFKKIEAGFTPKLQRAAELEKNWGEVEKIAAPHAEALKSGGWTVPTIFKAWMDVEQRLAKEPEAQVADIIKHYRVDPQKLMQRLGFAPQQPAAQAEQAQQPEQAPEITDPVVKALHDEIAALKGTVSGFTEHQRLAEEQRRLEVERQARVAHQNMQNEITAFAEAKGEDGQPSHPHFNDVIGHMLTLAQAERAAGRTPVLKDLYETAVWANPETRAKQLAAVSAAEQRKVAGEAKAKAAAAAKAGSSVSGAPSTAQTQQPGKSSGNLRNDIMAAFDELE